MKYYNITIKSLMGSNNKKYSIIRDENTLRHINRQLSQPPYDIDFYDFGINSTHKFNHPYDNIHLKLPEQFMSTASIEIVELAEIELDIEERKKNFFNLRGSNS